MSNDIDSRLQILEEKVAKLISTISTISSIGTIGANTTMDDVMAIKIIIKYMMLKIPELEESIKELTSDSNNIIKVVNIMVERNFKQENDKLSG